MAKLTMSEFRELAGSATRPAFAFRKQIEEMDRELQDFEQRTDGPSPSGARDSTPGLLSKPKKSVA